MLGSRLISRLRRLAPHLGALTALLAVEAQAQLVVVTETFTGTTAPGWVLSGQNYTPTLTAAQGIDANGSGWLRLTDNRGQESTYAYNANSFAATSDGVGTTVAAKFTYASYNGSGADGITFFLAAAPANGSTFSPGAYGGSLGYAQKTLAGGGEANIPGMTGGYIGLGIDEWGNYAGATEGRIGGIGTQLAGYPNAISVRGPGSGYTGYEYLGGTGPLGTALAFPNQTTRPTGADLRTFEVIITATNQLTVYMQTGTGPMNALYSIDLSGYARPDNLIMGFTGSTGGATDIHEIQGLTLTSMAARLWTNGDGTSTWGSSNNWNGTSGQIPLNGADILLDNTFVSSAQNINVNQNRIIRSLQIDAPFSYTLSNGSLQFSDQGVLGPSGIFVSQTHGSATQTINSNITLNNAIEIKNGSSGLLSLTGTVANNGNAILFEGSGATTVAGTISGSGGITKNDGGTVTLSGNNTYTGGTVLNAGTLNANSGTALGTGAVSLYGGTLGSTNGTTINRTLTLLGDAGLSGITSTGTLTQSGANRVLTLTNATQAGTVNLAEGNRNRTLTVDVDSGTSTISGVIQNGGNRDGSLTKIGDGVLTLSGANTYTGTTTVAGGTLQLGGSNRLATNPLVLDGGTFDLNNFSEKVGTLTFTDGGAIDFGTGVNGNSFVFGTLSTSSTGILTIRNWDSNVDVFASTQAGIGTTLLASIYFAGYGSGSIEAGNATDSGNGLGYAYRITPNSTFVTWNGANGSSNNWNATGPSNWVGGGVPSTSTTSQQKLAFTGTTRLGPVMEQNYYANSLKFDSNAGAFAINQNAKVLTLQGNVPSIIQQSANNQTISNGTIAWATGTNGVVDVSGTGMLTINSVLTGGGNINKLSGGTLALTGANSGYSGRIDVSAGLLQISGSNSVLGTGATNVSAGATLKIGDARTLANTITLSGTGLGGQGALNVAAGTGNTATLTSALALSNNATIQVASGSLALNAGVTGAGRDLTLSGAGNTSLAGPIALGTGSVTLNGSGTTTFSGGANTYTGATTVDGGTLVLNKAAGVIAVAGDLVLNSGAIDVNASNQIATSSRLTATGGTFSLLNGSSNTLALVNTSANNTLNLSTGSTLTINGAGVSTIDGMISGAGALSTRGTGTVVLANNNTYSGGTSIGSVATGMANGALGTGGASIIAGGNLQLQNNVTLANAFSLNSAGTTANDGAIENVSGNNTLTGALTLAGNSRLQSNSGTLAVTNSVAVGGNTLSVGGLGDTTISGVISGTGTLTKNGSGNLTLAGANTLSGTVRIDAGQLTMGASNVFANNSAMVLNGGTLAVGGAFSDTIGSLNLLSNSTIDYGKNTSTLTFGTATRSGGVLTIDNWAGDFSGGGASQLIFSSAPTNFATATDIVFTGYGAGYTRLASGEIVPLTGPVYTWQSTGSGNWTTDGNWTPDPTGTGVGPNLTSASVIFGSAIAANSTVTVSGTKTVGYMVFNDNNTYNITGGIVNLNVSGGSAQINVNNTGGGQIGSALTLSDNLSINQNSTGAFTVSGGISNASGTNNVTVTGTGATTISGAISIGGGSLTKNGTGTLTLSGTNTYAGGTTINNGTLAVGADANLGATTGALALNGGTLETTASFTLNAGRAVSIGAEGGTFQTDGATALTYNGVLTGIGTLTKTGTGTFTTGGASANTHSGPVDINAGTFEIAKTAAVSALNDASTVTIASGGTLRFNATGTYTSEVLGGLNGSAGAFVNNAGSNAFTLSVGANGADSLFGGILQNTGAALALTKTGMGVLTLSGNNTYTGATTISSGTLQIGAGGTTGTLGTAGVTNNSALSFNRSDAYTVANVISGSGTVIQSGTGTTALVGANTYTGQTAITAGTLQIGGGGTTGSINTAAIVNDGNLAINRSNTYALSNTISGSGSVTNLGTGTTTISGNNTYSGGTAVLAGTMRATSTAALGSGNLTIAGGATLQLATDASSNFGRNTLISGTGAATITTDRLTAGAGITQTLGNLSIGGQQLNIRSGTNVSANTAYGVTFANTTLTGNTTFDVANNGTATGTLNLGTLAGSYDVTKTGAGTLAFNGTISLTNLTLSGGTLLLGGDGMNVNVTNQFHITGNTTLDFGTGSAGRTLNVNNFLIDDGVTLTIKNWTDGVDYFFAQNWTGVTLGTRGQGDELQITFQPYSNTQTGWQSFDHQITPVPEPRTYGAIFLAASLAFLGWRRWRSGWKSTAAQTPASD